MGRRRTNILNANETLSQEKPEVQEKILEEIIKPDNSQDNEVKPVENKVEKKDNLSIKKEVKIEFKPGDLVKLNPNIKFDMVGRRIHAGLKGYQYRVLSVRIDGLLVIECLTHCFTVEPKDVYKV